MSISRCVCSGILVAGLALALALPAVAKKAKVPPCPPGNYALDVAEPLGPAGAPGFADVIAVDEAGNVSVESSCPAIEGKVKGSKKGTKVGAKWKKGVCAQLDGKVKLKAKTDVTCQTLIGKLKAKKHKAKFTATRAPAVAVELEAESRSAATLGPDGGSVEAIGADGTVYTLTLPEGALAFETEIAITPAASVADLPFGTLAGAAQFEPEGLPLFGTATLTIAPPGGTTVPEGQVLAGFDYTRAGDDFALGLVSEDGTSISVPVLHFSGAGSFFADPNDFDLSSQATPGAHPFIAELFLAATESDDATRVALTVESLGNWYLGVVRPRLQAAVVSDPALVRGAAEFARWREAIVGGAARLVDIDGPALLAQFESELAEAEGLLAAALRDGITRANASCLAEETLVGAEDALRWMHVARALLSPETVIENLLDNDNVLAELCVEILFEEVSFPEAPIAGEAETLTIVAGFAPRDGEIRFVFPLFVTAVGEQGVEEAFQQGETGPDGLFETFFTPTGGSNVRIDVEACLAPGDPELNLVQGICQTAFVLRGLIVSPIRATLAPGESQQFTAELGGAAVPVTWSADGGTIDDSGLFTAGSGNGSFTVTATSVADPDQISMATVTIEGEPAGGFPLFAIWEGSVVWHCEPTVCADGHTQVARLRTSLDPDSGALTARGCQNEGLNGASCMDNHCDSLWEGSVVGSQMSMTMVSHTSPCAPGDPGQNRLYGCELTATFSSVPRSRSARVPRGGGVPVEPIGDFHLVGDGDADFFSCRGNGFTTTFELTTPDFPEVAPD